MVNGGRRQSALARGFYQMVFGLTTGASSPCQEGMALTDVAPAISRNSRTASRKLVLRTAITKSIGLKFRSQRKQRARLWRV